MGFVVSLKLFLRLMYGVICLKKWSECCEMKPSMRRFYGNVSDMVFWVYAPIHTSSQRCIMRFLLFCQACPTISGPDQPNVGTHGSCVRRVWNKRLPGGLNLVVIIEGNIIEVHHKFRLSASRSSKLQS